MHILIEIGEEEENNMAEKAKEVKEYDKIRLKTGERGRILEIFDETTYLAEVVSKTGNVETTEIKRDEIMALIIEVEQAI
jgi:hypothetical protein